MSIERLDADSYLRGLNELAERDVDLGRVLHDLGPPPMWDRNPGFATLIHIILEQQVSLASARACFDKLLEMVGEPTPSRLLSLNDDALRRAGFSRQKTHYVKVLAGALQAGELDLESLSELPDDEVRRQLMRLKGIGRWTADIYLLMALGRPDVWPVGDLALAAAAQWVKSLEARPTPKEFAELGEAWRPWRSVAARLLWHHYLSAAGSTMNHGELSPQVSVIGVPTDVNSSFMKGAALAPDRIRVALNSPSTNLCAEDGTDLEDHPGWEDVGDMELGEGSVAQPIEDAVTRLMNRGRRILALGGDHAVTHSIVRALAREHRGLTIIHLDAHPDLYDEFEGSRESHACPFARIMEDGLAARLIQIGIRAMNPHQREQANRFGVEVHGARAVPMMAELAIEKPLYLSIDLDVLDPAHAPGVSHPEPGGLATRQVIDIIQDLPCPPAAADIVELNPSRDINGLTAAVAATLLKEVLAKMIG